MKITGSKFICGYLIIGALLCLLLNTTGLDFIVPGERIRDVVFENEDNVKNNLTTLVEERQMIRSMVTTAWAQYSPDYETTKKIQYSYNNKEIHMERDVVNGMRSYLLRTLAPDEGVLVILERMDPKKLNFNPHCFSYGGFYVYSSGLYLAILKTAKILNIKKDTGYYILNPGEMGKIFIALRFLNGLLAVGSFFLVFLIGRRLQGQWHGFISSLLFVFAPGIVIWNHFARPHVFMIFWVLMAVFFFLKALQDVQNERKNFVLACIFTGLIASILLPYGVVMSLMIPLTVFLKRQSVNSAISVKQYIKTTLFGFLLAACVFLIVNPYFLASLQEVIVDFQYTRMDARAEPSLQNYLYYLTVVLKMHMGTFLWVLFLLCVCVSLYRIKKEEWIILFPCLAGFLFLGTSAPNYLLRFVFFLPFAVLIAGNGIVKMARVKKTSPVVIVISVLCVFYTALYTISHVQLFRGNDVRFIAGEWINENLPQGASIGLNEAPVAFRTPPFSFAKFRTSVMEDIEKFDGNIPEYFVTSSFDWRFSDYETMKGYLRDYYELQTFKRVPAFLGIEFKTKHKRLPSDYCYFNPTIIIWKLKK